MIIQKIGKDLYIVSYAGDTRYFSSKEKAEKYRKELENKILHLV